jgi:hypothetical protein
LHGDVVIVTDIHAGPQRSINLVELIDERIKVLFNQSSRANHRDFHGSDRDVQECRRSVLRGTGVRDRLEIVELVLLIFIGIFQGSDLIEDKSQDCFEEIGIQLQRDMDQD